MQRGRARRYRRPGPVARPCSGRRSTDRRAPRCGHGGTPMTQGQFDSQAPAGQASPGIADAVLREVALTRAEYDLICRQLGRKPNAVELGMFGAMWSEHCGYKNSKPLLRRFPRKAPHVLVELGEENAGVVDIGDGLAIIFKIESHNHPSAVEPFQGAATGVGLLDRRRLVRARAGGEGNVVMLVGADTGRDGIHGASFASLEDPAASHRGVVQVGNPFLEKLLTEACLELLATDFVVGMQDLGAAGLTSAGVETASKGGAGIELDVAGVSRR